MKKIVSFCFFAFLAMTMNAQVTINNSWSSDIQVSSRDGGPIIIPPNGTKVVYFIKPKSEPQDIYLSYKQAGRIKKERVSVIVGSNLTVFPGMPSVIVEVSGSKNIARSPFESTEGQATIQPSSNNSVSLVVENASSHRFTVLTANSPFSGISLAPGDSSRIINVATTLHQFTILVDMDNDSISTGRNFAQAVIKAIVVNNQKRLIIRNDNIDMSSSGVQYVRLISQFDFKLVFVSGIPRGDAMKKRSKKYEFNLGFNSISVQFNKHGTKYQADLEFIVVRGERVLFLTEQNLKNIQML